MYQQVFLPNGDIGLEEIKEEIKAPPPKKIKEKKARKMSIRRCAAKYCLTNVQIEKIKTLARTNNRKVITYKRHAHFYHDSNLLWLDEASLVAWLQKEKELLATPAPPPTTKKWRQK